MFNKALVKLLTIITVLSLGFTIAIVAYGEDGGVSEPNTFSIPSETSSVVSESSEVSTPESSLTSGTKSETSSTEVISSDVSSVVSITSSEQSITSSQITSTQVASSVSSKVTISKTTSTSSKEKPKKEENDNKTESQSQAPQTYYTQSYDAGSINGTWDSNGEELEATSSQRELSKHIANPKKILLKWIWLPVLIALGCIGGLIYINVYVYGSKAKSKTVNDGFVYADEHGFAYLNEEEEEAPQHEIEDDPYSAENFFNFSDDN